MNAPMANLPVVIYKFAMSPYDDWRSLAWAGALLVTFERAAAEHSVAYAVQPKNPELIHSDKR